MDVFFVAVERGIGVRIPVTVPEYEIPILLELHGEAFVSPGDKVGEVKFEPKEAHEYLLRKYQQNQGAVLKVYPSAAHLGKLYKPEKKSDKE